MGPRRACCVVLLLAGPLVSGAARSITWTDVASVHPLLEARGITRDAFASYVEGIRKTNARRVREGDLDHLVFYILQSTAFTTLPPIEPALSAKTLVAVLDPPERDTFLKTARVPANRVPADAKARVAAVIRALDSPASDARLTYFRRLVAGTRRDRRDAALIDEYLRVMRFVYEKEFVAQRAARPSEAVADLYRTRGLSTDTAVEAGFMVHLGLGVIKSLQPDRRLRRVLIVGPGLDLAPRTGLLEEGPPQSYQPWAVIDALLDRRLADAGTLEVVAADINPRVVEHLRRARTQPPTLTLVSGIRDSETVTLSSEYREYFERLGRAIDDARPAAVLTEDPKRSTFAAGHLRKTVRIGPAAAGVLRAETLDIVTERLDGPAFDLVVATNILPYFNDVELMLAMSNVAGMVAPGGVFLHNEPRSSLRDVAPDVGLPFAQSRQVVIATVRGAPPLVDSVFLHRKAER